MVVCFGAPFQMGNGGMCRVRHVEQDKGREVHQYGGLRILLLPSDRNEYIGTFKSRTCSSL